MEESSNEDKYKNSQNRRYFYAVPKINIEEKQKSRQAIVRSPGCRAYDSIRPSQKYCQSYNNCSLSYHRRGLAMLKDCKILAGGELNPRTEQR